MGTAGGTAAVHRQHVTGLHEAAVARPVLAVRGLVVPEVLQGGNHAEIAKWRREQSIRQTEERRPDVAARRKKQKKQEGAP